MDQVFQDQEKQQVCVCVGITGGREGGPARRQELGPEQSAD